MYDYCAIMKFIPFLHSSNNVNTNHSISGGKLWQLFIVGKDVFVIVHDINYTVPSNSSTNAYMLSIILVQVCCACQCG